MTRRVIFHDIGGVLAPIRRWDRYGDLDPACIQVLNEIVARAKAEVVLSSTGGTARLSRSSRRCWCRARGVSA